MPRNRRHQPGVKGLVTAAVTAHPAAMNTAIHQTLFRRMPLILVAMAAVFGVVFLRDALSPAAISRYAARLVVLRDAQYLYAVIVFMAGYVAIVALSLPGATLATLIGGLLFGVFPGVVYNVAAASIGATLIFLAVRMGIGTEVAARLAAGQGAPARLFAALRQDPWGPLLAMRLLPAVPFFMANLLPAFAGVGLLPFVVTTIIGIIPATVIVTSLGGGLADVLATGGTPDLSLLASPKVVFPLLGLAGLALLPMVLRQIRGRT
jgi:uncharacterized membrane protein YdjX (TVP38/TMEM64 family)